MNEYLDNDKIIKPYNDLCDNKTIGHQHNFYKNIKNDSYNYNQFLKDKGCRNWMFKYSYDIDNEYIKLYLFGDKNNNYQFREDKFKTILACDIYYSKIIKNQRFKDFILGDYDNVFKDFLSKYIDTNSNLLIDKTKMKLIKFDKAYNDAFLDNNDKHRRFQKSKLKKQYKKYLECEDISQCELREQLHLIIALINMYIRHDL